MDNRYILKMLDEGKINELKKAVQDEIYQKELSGTPGAKKTLCCYEALFQVCRR